MKHGFFAKLAWMGIRKNKRLYVPYILTCIAMVAMLYIMLFLHFDGQLGLLPVGGNSAVQMMGFASWVIAIFSAIFLFYTNSFLMRRRKREFGLYNVLGMCKMDIARILVWENLIILCISLGCGLLCGILFSKLAQLGLFRLLGGELVWNFSLSLTAIGLCVAGFCAIFLLLLVHWLISIHLNNPIALMRAENVGEKPPRGNWFLGIVGAALLIGAYVLAVNNKDPVAALGLFFIAVIMVILATYLLFVFGSVLLCRVLQKNKRYYYKPQHFISISSMTYRMKRNGAGLASICILSTMVLVTLSCCVSLYGNIRQVVEINNPYQLQVEIQRYNTKTFFDAEQSTHYRSLIQNTLGDTNIIKTYEYQLLRTEVFQDGNSLEWVLTDIPTVENEHSSHNVTFMTPDAYRKFTNDTTFKDPGNAQAVLFVPEHTPTYHTLKLPDQTLQVIAQHEIDQDNPNFSDYQIYIVISNLSVLQPDLETLQKLKALEEAENSEAEIGISTNWANVAWCYCFDTDASDEETLKMENQLNHAFERDAQSYDEDKDPYAYYAMISSRAHFRAEQLEFYGGFLYIGILLSVIFLSGAVLIIYYKQICEGYEDRSRFAIMQKVGMTQKDIRKSINSQMLTVFFMPLLFAGLHLLFAAPMLEQIAGLLMSGYSNHKAFVFTVLTAFLIFAVFYILVYKRTSSTYYHIVREAKEQ